MEWLSGWAASVIAAAVLAGIVEFVLPKGNPEKPVRVLLSLFVLVSILAPTAGLLASPQQTKSGLDELLGEHEAQRALEQTVEETLEREIVSSINGFAAAEGLTIEEIRAVVSVGKDNIITVRRIEMVMNGTVEDRKKAEDFVLRCFFVQPVIHFDAAQEEGDAKENG